MQFRILNRMAWAAVPKIVFVALTLQLFINTGLTQLLFLALGLIKSRKCAEGDVFYFEVESVDASPHLRRRFSGF